MSARLLSRDTERPARHAPAEFLFRLDWPEFWLLIAVLGGVLVLVAFVVLWAGR